MGSKANHVSKSSETNKRKSKSCSNGNSDVNRDPKRVKQLKFVHLDDILKEDVSNQEKRLKEAIEKVIDIKNEEFIISQSVT